ncbi:DUF4097 family beta strand repeat-containing protein [Streptomyces sp. RFCAC02]|uniref:DUF4097 family beta strand repeat-containing protein n=1 Tax=Streptomyces sp. RFCAC02 TaxID=2499143 RepID=UPI0010218342|nr:DUF4097 family beta strand repeat-containing protein [Streptomyces sp. RFCAC02]
MQTFTTPAPISTVLDIPAGRVRFIAADRADTTVGVLPADASKGRDTKAAEQTTVSLADGVLRIEAPEARNQMFGASGSVEVTVHLPAGSSVRVATADTELRASGRLGEVSLESARGSVELDEAAGARITLSAGDISVGRLTGPGEISTQKGDITVAEAVRGTVTLRTEQGGITIGAAAGVSASLDAGTGYGRIENSLKNADGAAAGLTIHATTAHGDIVARSL